MPRLSRAEIAKDTLQGAFVATTAAVGEVTSIVTNAAKDIAGSVGGLATELFEIRDSARQAQSDLAPGETGPEVEVDVDAEGDAS